MKKFPFWICFIFLIPLNVFCQNTFIRTYPEGNFTVNPWIIENGPNGPIVCGFKSKENPNRGYFYCDQFDEIGNKIKTDSLLFDEDFFFYRNDDNSPVIFEEKIYWYKRGKEQYYLFTIDLNDISIEIIDTIDFESQSFIPLHMNVVSPDIYYFSGRFLRDVGELNPISDPGIAKLENGNLSVFSEPKLDQNNESSVRILNSKNDSIRIISNFSRGAIFRGFQLTTFDENLVKIDSFRTDFTQPRIQRIHDAIEDSEGNIAFVSWANWVYENYISYMSMDKDTMWHKEIGHNLNAEDLSRLSSIIESNDKKGYVFVGSDVTSSFQLDSSYSYAVVGKISKEGIMQWYRKYKFIDDTHGDHEFVDVVQAPDLKGYYLVGKMNDYSSNSIEPVQLILAKVDSMGLIDGYTNIESPSELNPKYFENFPNPINHHLTIRQLSNQHLDYEILSLEGRLMSSFSMLRTSEVKEIDTKAYPIGIYLVKCYSEENQVQVQKVIKHN